MANYKHYFNNGFSGCRLLAHAYDQHRNRDVRLYLFPGELETIGVTDGVDKWVAPTCSNFFSVDVVGTIRALRDGQPVKLPLNEPRSAEQATKPTRTRLALVEEPEPAPPRRRVLVDAPAPVSPVSRRRTLIA